MYNKDMKKIFLLVVPLLFLGSFSFVEAASLTVNDTTGADIDNGLCSIVEAIQNANGNNQSGSTDCVAGNGHDIITLQHNVTLSNFYGEEGYVTGTPFLTDSVTINGAGHSLVRASKQHFRFFAIDTDPVDFILKNIVLVNGSPENVAGGAIFAAAINSLTLDHVTINNSLTAGEGGAIYANGMNSITITDSVFSHNSGYIGGAIDIANAPATILNSKFFSNEALYGGAIGISYGDLTIDSSVFSDNSTSAIYTFGGEGQNANIDMSIMNSTFSGNHSTVGGGAIRAESTLTLAIVNSTFSGNYSDGASAISLYDSISNLRINFSTFVGNNSSFGSGVIRMVPSPAVVKIRNTIFNQNGGGDCSYFTNQGMFLENNLSDDGTCGTLAATGVNAVLANNGGVTKTHALLATSNAIDAAITNFSDEQIKCPIRDQRGAVRPVDGNADGIVKCDIGAFEYKRILTAAPQIKK
jgi:predicted outer membrane repeat protein